MKSFSESADCSVKTVQGEWCNFPFEYRKNVYDKCTKVAHDRPWCSTTAGRYKGKWGNCAPGEKLKYVFNKIVACHII